MPQALPLIGAALIAAGPLTTLGYVIAYSLILSPVIYNDRARRKANRAAQAAWEASLRDRAILVRSAELPRSITYGRVKISGELVYGRSIGSLQDRLLLVIALRPGHEIDAIEEVFFGERSLGTLDGNGYPTTGDFLRTADDNSFDQSFTASGNATTNVTATYTPVTLAGISAVYATGNTGQDGLPEYGRLVVTGLNGNVITFDTTGISAGTSCVVTYQRSDTSVWIRCKTYLGTATQVADPDAITDSGGEWTSNHRGRGVPALYVWLTYSPDVFPSGVENISAVVRGKKVYDPRSGLTVYSRNPALIARDYLTSDLGFGCPSSEIDDTLVSAAANICDEQVILQADPLVWQPRYTCDCDLSTEAARDENLQVILASMAGSAVYSQGKWRIHAGAYTAPSVTLDETALAGTEAITIQSRVQRSQLFNAVKGVFVSPENKWQPADYPIVTNNTYETQDGGERMVADLTLPATTNGWMAQRLAKIELERSRQALTVRAAFNLKAYRVQAGDTIGLTIARYGFSGKAFRVIDREFDFSRGVVLTLREDASGVYAWNSGEATEVDLAPNTTLPSPFTMPTMNAITLASGAAHMIITADGTVRPRIRVSWTALTDANVTQGGAIEIEWRELPAGAWQIEPPVPGDASQAYIAGVSEGHVYQVRARARNGLGVRSEWKYGTHTATSATGPVAPTALSVATAGNLRRFTITMPNIPLNLGGFEIRYASGGSITWSSATIAATFAYTNGTGPFTFDSGAPTAAGTYSFEVRSVDGQGNLSSSGAQALSQTLTAIDVGGGNLIANSSFEADTDSNGIADSWAVFSGSGVPSAYRLTTPIAHGTYSHRLDGTLDNGAFTVLYQSVSNIEGSKAYSISGYIAGTTTLSGFMNVDWYNGAAFISASSYYASTNLTAGMVRHSAVVTAPASANIAFVSFGAINLSGATRSYGINIDAVQFQRGDVATGYAPKPDEVLPGTITISQQSTPADGQHTQANFTAPAALGTTQIGTVTYTNNTGAIVEWVCNWTTQLMGSGGGGTAGAYPKAYATIIKNSVEQKRYTNRTSRNGTDWGTFSGQHKLTLASGDVVSLTLYAAWDYVTSGTAIGGTLDWKDASLFSVVYRA